MPPFRESQAAETVGMLPLHVLNPVASLTQMLHRMCPVDAKLSKPPKTLHEMIEYHMTDNIALRIRNALRAACLAHVSLQ